MKALYVTLVVIDAILVAVLLLFFLWGLADGSVSAFNGALWLAMLAIPAALSAGGLLAWRKGNRAAAIVLLLIPGAPAALCGLLILLFIILQPDMR